MTRSIARPFSYRIVPAWVPAGVVWLVLSHGAGAAEIYKWVDEQGKLHYSDHPPASGKAEHMDIKPQPAEPAPDAAARQEKQRRLLDAYEEDRAEKKEANEKEQAAAAERKKLCEEARKAAFDYQSAALLYDIDAKTGERIYLPDEEADKLRKQAQERVKELCKP